LPLLGAAVFLPAKKGRKTFKELFVELQNIVKLSEYMTEICHLVTSPLSRLFFTDVDIMLDGM
jgi:hypothetical protein